MVNFWTWVLVAALATEISFANPPNKDLKRKTKKGGSPGGFYSSRFGSVYDAKDFVDEPTTTVAAPLREAQVPSGVAGPHQQNIDEDIKSEVPNIEEHTAPNLPSISEDFRLGVKGRIHYRPPSKLSTESPLDTPIRVTIEPNGAPSVGSDVTEVRRPLISDNLTKKKTKGIKGGDKGYHYDVKRLRDLFSDDKVTERSFEATTVDNYNPQILNLPTERRTEVVTAITTENYRQETVAPVQQTEEPIQQTEIPVQQTEEPVQQTEVPVQQTEEPIRETEPTTRRPVPTTLPPITTEHYEPVQDTQSPIEPQVTEKPELPHTTLTPTTTEYYNEQQTEIPQETQHPEEPYQVTEVTTTQLPIKIPDEFSRYPLGMDGSLPIRGGGYGKGKGSKGGKGSKKGSKVAPSVSVLSRGSIGVASRRKMDPATPLLPSLRGFQG